MKRGTPNDTDSPDEAPVIAPPSGGGAPQSGSLLQRLKAWVRGLSDGATTSLILLGVAVGAVLVFRLLTPDPTQVMVYVYGPEENVFIDGVPVTRLKKDATSAPFATGFGVTGEKPEYEITIKNGDQVAYRKKVGRGDYMINATTDFWVAAESIMYGAGGMMMKPYGSMNGRHYEISPGGLGAYQLSGTPGVRRPVDFRSDAPTFLSAESPGSRRPSPGTGGSYLKLHVGRMTE